MIETSNDKPIGTVSPDSDDKPNPTRRFPRWQCAASGFILGALIALGGAQLGTGALPVLGWLFDLPVAGCVGALLGLGRGRRILWGLGAAIIAALFGVSYSPLAAVLMSGLVERETPGSAPAVVVLSSDIFTNGEPNGAAHLRLLHSFELLKQGRTPRLIVTRLPSPAPSYVPAIRRLMENLGIDAAIDEAGEVSNTHDEAVLVAAMARRNRWDGVILVTQPWHMRRAAATFRKAGIAVIQSPCSEGSYDINNISRPGDRLHAFRNWLHETIGIRMYRMRGWM